jgi:motility quorum-sensing regulator / GCU-specific mRNA interferase toxin
VLEKRKPHCPLSVIHALVEAKQVRATGSALRGAAAMDLEFDDMLDVICALTTRDFYKSMTSHTDHRVWQDVYQPTTTAGDVYLKLTVIDDVLIVSFKEL